MKPTTRFAAIAIALILGGCSATVPPPPAVTPAGNDRFIVDPRIGFTGSVRPGIDEKFDLAWRYFLAGNEPETTRLLTDLRTRSPQYLPAHLAEAARFIRENRPDEARGIVDELLRETPDYTAARIYSAELALQSGDLRGALARYRTLGDAAGAPSTVGERIASLESQLYESLINGAAAAGDSEAITQLREALSLRPSETEPRISLVQRLITMKQYEEARRMLEPMINSTAVDRPEVQASLAEIDISRGRYQEAIVRLDRLAKRTRDPRHTERLDAVKSLWTSANMPMQYTRALETESITRTDLAVLMYWEMNSVRFAQNLSSPPIAVDVADVPGREEVIRAIAIGLYDVDPITRRVSPMRPVTAGYLTRLAARLLTLRGATCARVAPEPGETSRSARILAACGVTDPLFAAEPELPVTGRAAAKVLQQLERTLSR